MGILWGTLDFAVRGLVVFLVIAASLVLAFGLSRRRQKSLPRLEVRPLNRRFEALAERLRAQVMEKKKFRAWLKERRQQRQAEPERPKVYLLEFEGDILATQVEHLREEVTALVEVAKEGDEVVVKVHSAGGAVPHYGLAAAQLQRLKERKLKVTVCIDRIAASGGYLMACVAHHIVAAPFSVIGSIGVVAQVPNIHRLLKRHHVDVEELTAGEYKRTVSLLGEVTDKGRQKLQEQLDDTHLLFKDFVKAHRSQLDVEKLATGEYWLGTRSLELGLVDALGTSDDYLLSRSRDADIFKISYHSERPWKERLGRLVANVLQQGWVPARGPW